MAMGEQCAALEDHGGFKMARDVLTGDSQLISNALWSIFRRVFLFFFFFFCSLTSIQFKKIMLTDALIIFPSKRALMLRVRIRASTLKNIYG